MALKINADFDKRAAVKPSDYQWVPSPMPGVERMMLDRIGDEVARATSLVLYVPHSTFSPHTHGGGEEFYVLEGVFADEHGAYPAGSYARNPIGTNHTPRIGAEGAVIFVKLHQFEREDQAHFVKNTAAMPWRNGSSKGVSVKDLHHFKSEHVALVRLSPDAEYAADTSGGHECFVLEGVVNNASDAYPAGSWIRTPSGEPAIFYTKAAEAVMFVKTGHLPLS